MSTRSRIGILKNNGSIESIYCHLDGYPEWVGKKLYRYYNDPEKINNLIQLGDISHLENNLEPNPEIPHKFGYDTEQKDVVVAYHRDRNEDWSFVKPLLSKDIKEFEKYCLDSDQEYAYLYDEKNSKFIWSEIPWNSNEKMNFSNLEDKLIELGIVNPELDNIVWKIVDYEKDNDLYEFRDEYDSDEDAFESLKKYFIENGFEDYKNSLKDNILILEEDKNDSTLGKLYKKANNLLKEINNHEVEKDLEL